MNYSEQVINLEEKILYALRGKVLGSPRRSKFGNFKAIGVNVFDYVELALINNRLTFIDDRGDYYSVDADCTMLDLAEILDYDALEDLLFSFVLISFPEPLTDEDRLLYDLGSITLKKGERSFVFDIVDSSLEADDKTMICNVAPYEGVEGCYYDLTREDILNGLDEATVYIGEEDYPYEPIKMEMVINDKKRGVNKKNYIVKLTKE